MTTSGWVSARLFPSALLVVVAAAGAAYLRGRGIFLAGLQGMGLGVFLGLLIGRIGRGDPREFWTFGQRIWLSLGLTVVFVSTHLSLTSVFHAGTLDSPFAWLTDILNGNEREPFFAASPGARVGMAASASGLLSGPGWVAWNLVDVALFAFMLFASVSIGYFKSESTSSTAEEDPATGSRAARGFFLAVCLLLVGGGALAWARQAASARADSPWSGESFQRVKGMQGDWVFANDAGGSLGKAIGNRKFTLAMDSLNSLTGASADGSGIQVQLEWQGTEFTGQLVTPTETIAFRAKAEAGDARLRFVAGKHGGELVWTAVRSDIGARRAQPK